MTTIHHISISVRGVLHKGDAALWEEYKSMTVDDRPVKNAREIREAFMNELAEGREKVPFGDPCKGYSYIDGCPGHKKETTTFMPRHIYKQS